MIKYKLKTAPSVLPVSIYDVKRNLRIATTDIDTDRDRLIDDLISEATTASQNATGRQYCRAAYTAYLDAYPDGDEILITLGPVVSITSVKYYAPGANTLTTLSASSYQLDNTELSARLRFFDSFSVDSDRLNPIEIEFVNGWDNEPQENAPTTTASPTTTATPTTTEAGTTTEAPTTTVAPTSTGVTTTGGTTTSAPTTTEAPTTTAAPTTTEVPQIGYIPKDLKQAVILRACDSYLNPDNEMQNFGMSTKIKAAEIKERNYRVQRF